MVCARKKEGDTHAVTTAPTWMKAPQNIQSSYQPNPPNFSIRAKSSLPTQVKGPPATERTPAQRTTPATPRPVNNTAPDTSYNNAQHPHPKISTFPMRAREFRRWKGNRWPEKQDAMSPATEMRVPSNATSERSTGARNASSDGDRRRRSDENMAAEAIGDYSFLKKKNVRPR